MFYGLDFLWAFRLTSNFSSAAAPQAASPSGPETAPAPAPLWPARCCELPEGKRHIDWSECFDQATPDLSCAGHRRAQAHGRARALILGLSSNSNSSLSPNAPVPVGASSGPRDRGGPAAAAAAAAAAASKGAPQLGPGDRNASSSGAGAIGPLRCALDEDESQPRSVNLGLGYKPAAWEVAPWW